MQNCIETLLLFQVSHWNRCYMSLTVVVGWLCWAGWHHSHRGLGGVLTGQGRAWLKSQLLRQFPVRAGETCLVFAHFYCLSLEIRLCSRDALTMSSLLLCSSGMNLMERDIWYQGTSARPGGSNSWRSNTESSHLHSKLKVIWTAKWME